MTMTLPTPHDLPGAVVTETAETTWMHAQPIARIAARVSGDTMPDDLLEHRVFAFGKTEDDARENARLEWLALHGTPAPAPAPLFEGVLA